MKYKTPFIMLLALVAASVAQAQSGPVVPGRINYQGRLVSTLPGPPEVQEPLSSGQYDMEFWIYDDPDAGQVVWGPQTFAGNEAVPVVGGYFGVVLSEDDEGDSIAEAFEEDGERYVEAKATVDAPPAHILGPRERILGTAYAVKAEHGVPPGTTSAFAGPAPPPGWLLCDGTTVDIDVYPALYQAITDYWGEALPSNPPEGTFTLPDLRGRFLRGAGTVLGVHPRGKPPEESGFLHVDIPARHAHDMSQHTHGAGGLFLKLNVQDNGGYPLPNPDDVLVSEVNTANWSPNRRVTGLSQVEQIGADNEARGVYLGGSTGPPSVDDVGVDINLGGGGPAETRPRNVYVNYIIKY